MESLTKSYDYRTGMDLLRQDYLVGDFELMSADGLTEPERTLLRRELADEHRLRCAQEWKAIGAQLRSDLDVRTRQPSEKSSSAPSGG
jgi:hypothetical protein